MSEEELEESDEEIEEEIEEDEEEMRQMLHTLQRVYNEVCSPTPPPVDTDSESEEKEEKKATGERSSTLDESWLESSGSLSSSEGGVSENMMTFSRLEKARMVLEDALGLDTLLHAYGTIQVRLLGTTLSYNLLSCTFCMFLYYRTFILRKMMMVNSFLCSSSLL